MITRKKVKDVCEDFIFFVIFKSKSILIIFIKYKLIYAYNIKRPYGMIYWHI